MNTRRTAQELIKSLESDGLRFRSFALTSEGNWTAEDADWNYKDIPHLNVVHDLATAVPAAIDDDLIATLNLQQIGPIGLPLALVNYVARDGSQVYYTSMLWFVLVIETQLTDLPGSDTTPSEKRSCVVTTYHVGSQRWALWLFPLLRRTLTRNYHELMRMDIPMREQRGKLRAAGYSFASDGRPRTFPETTDLTVVNVIAPDPPRGEHVRIECSSIEDGDSRLIGGPRGLRLHRQGQQMLVFERVCNHEGACLDSAKLSNESVVCPWHNKRIKPAAVLALESGPQAVDLPNGYRLHLDDGYCTVSTAE